MSMKRIINLTRCYRGFTLESAAMRPKIAVDDGGPIKDGEKPSLSIR